MNKSELIKAMAVEGKLTQKDAGNAVDAFMSVVKKAMSEGDNVMLVGFGNFSVKDIPEKGGRNPRTGESILIPAHKKVSFKLGSDLKAV